MLIYYRLLRAGNSEEKAELLLVRRSQEMQHRAKAQEELLDRENKTYLEQTKSRFKNRSKTRNKSQPIKLRN